MATNKKEKASSKKPGRRDSDRRANANRRSSDNRRTESRIATPSPKKQSPSLLKRLFKYFVILLIIFVLVITGSVIVIFSNLEYFVNNISKHVIVKLEHASIDPSSLTQKVCRAKLTLGMKNNLPVGLVFTNIKYNVKLSEYKIANGVQAKPMLIIPANTYKRLPINFHVDSIKTRRALQKVVRENTQGLLQVMLSKINGKTKSLANDVKQIIKVEGTADFNLSLRGIKIPFTKTIEFNSN